MKVAAADTLQVAVVADLLEERWPSMDLMADMLMAHAADTRHGVNATLVRPTFAAKVPAWARGRRDQVPTVERIAHRFWSYPRWLQQQPSADVYHIVDHSYAHLAHSIPAGRAVITCHDIDAFRSVLAPGQSESRLPRFLVKRVLSGFRSAAAIVCDSDATRREIVRHGLASAERTSVVPIGVHPACSPEPDAVADAIAAKLTGDLGPADLLHVGSTIPRKQIELLLEVVSLVSRTRPDLKLWRVGGAFTPDQAKLARKLGVEDRIKVMPFITRPVLAALYRRAALVLLPSSREGFGLPVIEAMACGTPIVCSDLPVLREVGDAVAEYCAAGQPVAWATKITAMLDERAERPVAWAARRSAGLARASKFTWERYADAMREIYRDVASASAVAVAQPFQQGGVAQPFRAAELRAASLDGPPATAGGAPIDVLHVGKFYPPAPGGMERMVQLLCEGDQPGTRNRVLVANTGVVTTREPWQGVDVTRVGSIASIGSVGVCPTFPVQLWRARRDVTVIHEPNPLALVSDWASAQAGPLVVWFHSEVIRPRWKYRLLYRPFLRRVLKRAARIVVSSPALAEHAEELRDFRAKCVVIPFGIDTARLERTAEIDAMVDGIAARYPGPRVLFVGRLVAYKGLEVLLKAAAQAPGTILIAGDGPLAEPLKAQAAAAGLGSTVQFLGHLTDKEIVAHFHACDVFVLPSVTRAETFGVVQLEAMACGKPVVSTNLPTGVPWVNRHMETGLVVPPGDPDALAAALTTLVSDPAWSRKMGERAQRRVLEEFTVAAMTTRSAALYREVLLERTAALAPQAEVVS